MQPQTYKLYTTSSPGSGYFAIDRLANPVPGYREVSQEEATQLAQQHAAAMDLAYNRRRAGENLTSGMNGEENGSATLTQLMRTISNPGEAFYASYTHPYTGEVMRNVSQSTVDSVLAKEAAVANGTMRRVPVGNGVGYMPIGSAADIAMQGGTGAGNTVSTGTNSGTASGTGTTPRPSGLQLITGTLNLGSQGDQVKALQQYLQGLGYKNADGSPIKVDGVYGPQTKSIVAKFQSDHGLQADGIFGSASRAKAQTIASTSTPATPNGDTTPTVNGSTVTYNGQTYDASNPQEASFLQAILESLNQITTGQGMVINPNMDLTPDVIAKILEKAKATVHPQFAQQIAGIQEDLRRNSELTKASYEGEIADRAQSFEKNLGNAREQYADSGLAFSGQRGSGELGMQSNENRTLDSLSSQYGQALGGYARNTEQQLGTAGYNSGYQIPSLANYRADLGGNGGYNNSGTVGTGYTPGTYQLGSVPLAETASALALRNQNIEEASRRKAAGLSYADLYQ